nr:MAG TPA: hypothetical protein [Caudoviricetes sp.]
MQALEHIGVPRKRHAERIERIINAFVPRKAFAPLPSCRLWSRSAAGLPTALSRYLGLNRKACHPSALTQAFGRVPAFRRAESGGTKLRDSAL